MSCGRPRNNTAQGGLGSLFAVWIRSCKPRHADNADRSVCLRASAKIQTTFALYLHRRIPVQLDQIQLVRLYFHSIHADQPIPPPWTSAVLCLCEVYNPVHF